jgi:two-component system sporulation sensor kinase A
VILDYFPIKLPSGDEYTAGTIGSLLLMLDFGLTVGLFSIIMSLFLLSIKKYRSFGQMNWVRYFATLGMYFICSLLAWKVFETFDHVNLFLQVFLTTAMFEISNHFLLMGIKKTLFGVSLSDNFWPKMWELVIPVLIATLVISRFLVVEDASNLMNDVVYTGFFLLVIIFFSNEFSKDITKRKRIEEELRSTKEQLESFINQTADAIAILDLNGQVMRVNHAFEATYGWTSEEVLGKHIPLFTEKEIQNVKSRLSRGEPIIGFELVRQRKDGASVYISLTLSLIRDAKGEVTAIAGIARDITRSKLAEEALRESEAKYRLIAENMSDIIGVLGTDGKIKYISPSYQAVLGTPPPFAETEFNRIHPEDRPRVRLSFFEMMKTKTACQIECRYRHFNENWIMLDTYLSPVLGDHDQVEQVVFVVRDITERKMAEELLRKSDKLSIVGQLAAGVAHEIRNPLTAIRGFTQLLQTGKMKEEYISIMLSELDRIELIVNEFLLLAKPQAVIYQQRDVRTLLWNIVALLEAQAIMNNIQIKTKFQDHVPLINCEENQLKQVFINVLKNAIEAMSTGGTIDIQVLNEAAGEVLIRFVDEGNGIPEERISRLGEPFYTTKEKGTGLGLMISYKIIQEHQGQIQIISQINRGTVVEIRLPVAEREVMYKRELGY